MTGFIVLQDRRDCLQGSSDDDDCKQFTFIAMNRRRYKSR
jgi:hypothetical protein